MGNSYFGKDERLTQPPTVRNILYKVHIKPRYPKADVKRWNRAVLDGKIPTSDHILIYTTGIQNENAYLLLDILRPEGHKKLLDFARLEQLAVLAGYFRESY
ncbi:hypothetical protein BegalDRAFT_2520 [Beggiatoa alba B18LD]|uniref:Uncharacterized protein n=1 Tax=Beggiatoa alba B18LD TaxID=395493 RepID=I3CIC0_9GAMM|nr:type II toxin-antitoxin system YafO family toxin [Beggiatoa alba]EIJ43363.1 hypothetical protein BegalDRAFT_2520 [Beggiatoa alba B18LD]